ncbi:hypothetical protein [Georgenia subflava]|uniref:hypothetical protein n=1 Tax=Georgenia subflava TaxID=1622177 RepID=UPI00186B5486|nr:hypothetical protein [Georgenia subflava]
MSASRLPSRNFRNDSSLATLGLDLTGLGVCPDATGLSTDLPVEKANLAKLASYTRAAHDGGVSFVSLGEGFRLRSDRAVRRDDWLDPVVAARRISPHAGAAGLVPTVPAECADISLVAGELAQIPRTGGTWTGLQLAASDSAGADAVARSLDGISRSFGRARAATGRASAPRVVLPVGSERDIELAGSYADVVRVREDDLGWARELRFAVRAAARAAGRDVRVLVDLHTVVSADRASAEERAGLVADIAGPTAPWAGALRAVGTTTDVADLIQSWLTAGAADGFVIVPGSVPADIAALLRGIVPELRARGLVEEKAVASRPTAVRPEVETASASSARRLAAVPVAS